MLVDRRRALAAGAALVCAPMVFRDGAAAAADPFTLGVASGEPWPNGFVIWTRLAPDPLAADGQGGMTGPAQVRWEVASDEAMRRIVRRGTARTEPHFAHALHIEVAGLEPDRPYFYRFTAMGRRSPVGRARTAPDKGRAVPRIRIAAASCAHWESGFFAAYRHMAAEQPDLVLFLGDYIYEYSYPASRQGLARRTGGTGEVRDLAGYRNRYALHRTDPDLRALHAAAPCLATWDDHEVQNDYAADFSQIGTIPAEEFRARRIAAYRAFYEHMPLRRRARPDPQGGVRLYHRAAFGDLLEVTVLDARQHRSAQACQRGGSRRGYVAPESCADLADPSRSMLGLPQEQWLYDGFRAASARWNLIAQQLLVAPYAQKGTDGAMGVFTEGWAGYAANRDRMLSALADSRMANPVLLGGDMHAFVAADLKADFRNPRSRTIASEFIGTSVTSDGSPDSIAETLPLNPHVHMVDNRYRGYMALDLTPQRLDMRFQAISNRLDRAATVSTLKRFGVEAGKPGVIAQ